MLCSQRDGRPDRSCYETILDTMAEAVLIVDREQNIMFCNPAASEISGYSEKELLGKSCQEILDCGSDEDDSCDVFKTGEISGLECLLKRKKGSKLPIFRNARVMRTKTGKPMGAVETLTDISKLKKTEKRLEHLQRSLKEQYKLRNIVGKGELMQELFRLIDLAANSNSTILVTGESGTGKELIAEAIHYKGQRKNKPLVKISCSALPETLLESELFGHAKGAFTGAIKDKPGRFETAHHGTLFLDEIGEISPLVQLKLLRFLQEKEFERVGESKTRKADVRIISATNKDLFSMVKEGKFREDLYYRLKVFSLHAPPLRERKEDLGLLVDHFIEKFNSETGKSLAGVSHAILGRW